MEAPVTELIGAIYEASLDPSRWSSVMRQMEHRIGAFTSHIFLRRGECTDVDATGLGYSDTSFADSYELYYAKHDPMPRLAMSRPTGQLITDEDALPKHEFLNSEFYSDWIKPQGIFTCLYTNAFRDGHRAAHLCLTRERGTRPFGPKQASLIAQLIPHVCRAAEIHFRLNDAAKQREALSRTFGFIGQEVILVNRDCKPVFASPGAEARMRIRDGLTDHAHGLRASSDRQTRALRQLIAQSFVPAPSSRSPCTLHLQRPNARRPISVTIVPAAASGLAAGAADAHVMLFVGDPEWQPASRAQLLREHYGLTASEARLADMVLAGYTLAAAAERLGVAVGTVRNQLKQVFQKTDTHRQSELVSLLLRLPVQESTVVRMNR